MFFKLGKKLSPKAAIILVVGGMLFSANAAPYMGDVYNFKQPDGSDATVLLYGDEYSGRMESEDGYSVVVDPKTGYICYAALSLDEKTLISTGVAYKKGSKALSSSAKHISLSSDIVKKIRESNYLLLNPKLSSSSVKTLNTLTVSGIPDNRAGVRRTGNVLGLTIVVDFSDDTATRPVSDVEQFMNTPGYNQNSNNGSIRDYFFSASNGNLQYTNHVAGIFRAPQTKAYYNDTSVAYGTRARELVRAACQWLDTADTSFRFSTLTNDNNQVLAVNIFYAGSRPATWSKGLWPHKSSLSTPFVADGVQVVPYTIQDIGTVLTIGTMCHENGHLLMSWPDCYDYGYESQGTGSYDLMAYGGSNYYSRNPAYPNAFFRYSAGWVEPVDLTYLPNGQQVTLRRTVSSIYKFVNHNGLPASEMFLFEYLDTANRNRNLPDHGMMIWHCDINGNNDNEQRTCAQHYRVAVEQADGLFDLERQFDTSSNVWGMGGPNDLFHAGNRNHFTDTSTGVNSNWWCPTVDGNNNSFLSITNISAMDSVMTFIYRGARDTTFTHDRYIPWTPVSRTVTIYGSVNGMRVCVYSTGLGLSLSGIISSGSWSFTVTPRGRLDTIFVVATGQGYRYSGQIITFDPNISQVILRRPDSTIRAYFPTIETALANIQSNETAEVLAGSYTVASEVNLTDTSVSHIKNIKLIFASPYITVILPKAIALPCDGVSEIKGIDSLNLANPFKPYSNYPKILVLNEHQSDTGRVRAIVSVFSYAMDTIAQQNETVVLGPGEIAADDFFISDKSLAGVHDPVNGSTIIRLTGPASTSPIKLIGGNYGVLLKDLVLKDEETGQTESTLFFEAEGGRDPSGKIDTVFRIENCEFIGTPPDSAGYKSVAMYMKKSAAYGWMKQCMFKNFYYPFVMDIRGGNDYQWSIDASDWSNCRIGPYYSKDYEGYKKCSNSNFGVGPDTARIYMYLGYGAVQPPDTSDTANVIRTKSKVIQLVGSANNPFFTNPRYVDSLNGDYRLVSKDTLIDAHTDGYSDINSIQANTVITSSAFLNVTATLPGNHVISFINGNKSIDPSIPVGAVEIYEKTDHDLRPVSLITIKQKTFGNTISISIGKRNGFAIPPLQGNYVVSETRTNCQLVSALTFSFSDLAAPPVKSALIDSTSPIAPASFTAGIVGSDVLLNWYMSAESDVMRYKIYRTASPTVQIASLPKALTSYVDIGAAGLGATYAISVYDSMGNESVRSQAVAAMCIYVDDDGSDSTGDGSLAKPYQTISKAIAQLPSNPANSYIISIFPGEYEEHVVLNNTNRIWTATKRLSFKPRYNIADSMPLWCGAEISATQHPAIWGTPFILPDFRKNKCLSIENEDYVSVEGIRFAAALPPDSATECRGWPWKHGKNCKHRPDIRRCNKPSITETAVSIGYGADHATISRCFFLGEPAIKLYAGIEAALSVDSLKVENCIFYGLSDGAIRINRSGRLGSGVIVVNNTFYQCGSAVSFEGKEMGRVCKRDSATSILFTNNIVTESLSAFVFSGMYLGKSMVIKAVNSDFSNLSKGIIMPKAFSKYITFTDTLMRDPFFASTDVNKFGSSDFMKPTLPAVACGGLSTTFTPKVDFFNKTRDIPISMGAVEGAQSAGEGLAKRMIASAGGVRLPMVFEMSQSYPNPFRQKANIRFQIPGAEKVRTCIEILRIDGRVVKTLVNDERTPGYHTVAWDGLGKNQETIPAGTYLYRIKAGNFHDVKRMVLMR